MCVCAGVVVYVCVRGLVVSEHAFIHACTGWTIDDLCVCACMFMCARVHCSVTERDLHGVLTWPSKDQLSVLNLLTKISTGPRIWCTCSRS